MIVDMLNVEYEQMLQKKISIFVTYSDMIDMYPYRVLSSYAYDFDEKSLRSDRIAERPPSIDPVASDVEPIMEGHSSLPVIGEKKRTVEVKVI